MMPTSTQLLRAAAEISFAAGSPLLWVSDTETQFTLADLRHAARAGALRPAREERAAVPYHTRIAILLDMLEAGALGVVDLAALSLGYENQPIQALLRDRRSLRCQLADLNPDGSITFDEGPYVPYCADFNRQ